MQPVNFVNMCKAAKIALPVAGARLTFLSDAGAIPSVAIARDAERCAALAWARDSPSGFLTNYDIVVLCYDILI